MYYFKAKSRNVDISYQKRKEDLILFERQKVLSVYYYHGNLKEDMNGLSLLC